MKIFKVALLSTLAALIAGCIGITFYIRSYTHYAPSLFTKRYIIVDGLRREYRIALPRNKQRRKLPLVVGLHGGILAGSSFAKRTHLDEFIESDQFILVLPISVTKIWNSGSNSERLKQPLDDVNFIRQMIEEVVESEPVDESAIFAVGYSSGASFALRLGCQLSEKFAGVVSVVGSLPTSLSENCPMPKPVSLLFIHGKEDPIIRYEGGEIDRLMTFWKRGGGGHHFLSVEATIELWRGKLKCAMENRQVEQTIHAQTVHYHHCLSGSFVTWIEIAKMGHHWPPFKTPFGFLYGQRNSNLNATEEVRKFIRDHSKK